VTPRDHPRFKYNQHVMVLGMLVNGERIDMGGFVQGYGRGPATRNKVEVTVNGVHLYFEEDRLMDFSEYWERKRANEG